MPVIVIDSVIGGGKSTLTQILSNELGTIPFYEPVSNNPILPLFYRGNKLVEEGKWKTNPYAFELQIYYLNKRFRMIKEAMKSNNNVLDRAIYSDALFARANFEQGHMTEGEWDMYADLLDNMMEEIPLFNIKKSPDLMVYIKLSYETMIKRIKKRGREFEQLENDPSLEAYYKDLLRRYAGWEKEYDASPMLVIDGDKYDFVTSLDDRKAVLKQIYEALIEVGTLTEDECSGLIEKLDGLQLTTHTGEYDVDDTTLTITAADTQELVTE